MTMKNLDVDAVFFYCHYILTTKICHLEAKKVIRNFYKGILLKKSVELEN